MCNVPFLSPKQRRRTGRFPQREKKHVEGGRAGDGGGQGQCPVAITLSPRPGLLSGWHLASHGDPGVCHSSLHQSLSFCPGCPLGNPSQSMEAMPPPGSPSGGSSPQSPESGLLLQSPIEHPGVGLSPWDFSWLSASPLVHSGVRPSPWTSSWLSASPLMHTGPWVPKHLHIYLETTH